MQLFKDLLSPRLANKQKSLSPLKKPKLSLTSSPKQSKTQNFVQKQKIQNFVEKQKNKKFPIRQNISTSFRIKQTQPIDNNDLNVDFVVEAIRNSYVKKVSNMQQKIDFLQIVGKFVQAGNKESMAKQGQPVQLKHYFKIVQINQQQLFPNQISFNPFCSSINKQKYQLLLTLDAKQLKLQSLANKKRVFNVNFDTVQCKLLNAYVSAHNQAHIMISVGDQVIDIFINEKSLPYSIYDSNKQIILSKYIKQACTQLQFMLRKSIQTSRGYQFHLRSILSLPSYETLKFSTQQQFSRYAQTGDILLFKDDHTFAKIQRAITNSQYDHIAFVYRSQRYGICLVQCSSGLGVGLTVWNHLIRHKWFQAIQTITWRRLLIHNKQQDFQQKVTDFVNNNLHKKYGISLGKLLKRQSYLQNEVQDKDRTYFCSQLIAHLYKHLGLLPASIASSSYWPKDFSQKGSLSMRNNSALQHERILLFEPCILKQTYKGFH